MSVATVMLVKDEADVIGTVVEHMLAHTDEVFVADNLSTDGTLDILEQMRRDVGDSLRTLNVLKDETVGYYQAEKTTKLAQLALVSGHRWVIPCDADELWFAPEGRLIKDWLAGIGRELQFVKAAIYNHVCTALDPPDEENPFRRIGWRQRAPFDRRWGKVACRLRPDLQIHMGNHSASTSGTGMTGDGLEIRHFPYRSPEQFVHKAIIGAAAYKAATELDQSFGVHWRTYGRVIEEGGEEAGRAWFYEHFYSSDPESDETLTFNPALPREGAG
jgi:hypothetical protein